MPKQRPATFDGKIKRLRTVWIAVCAILGVVLLLGIVAIVLDQKGAFGDPRARTPLILSVMVAVFASTTLVVVFFASFVVTKHLPLLRQVMNDLGG